MAVTDRYFYIYMICSHAVDNFFLQANFIKLLPTNHTFGKRYFIYLIKNYLTV